MNWNLEGVHWLIKSGRVLAWILQKENQQQNLVQQPKRYLLNLRDCQNHRQMNRGNLNQSFMHKEHGCVNASSNLLALCSSQTENEIKILWHSTTDKYECDFLWHPENKQITFRPLFHRRFRIVARDRNPKHKASTENIFCLRARGSLVHRVCHWTVKTPNVSC